MNECFLCLLFLVCVQLRTHTLANTSFFGVSRFVIILPDYLQ